MSGTGWAGTSGFGQLACLLLLALFGAWAWAAEYSGVVTRVRDGDTVQVTTDRGRKLEVRLEAVDAPEKARNGHRAQRYANQSRAALARIAMNRRVTVQSSHTDRYGRRVGVLRVHTAQGELDAGLVQVQLGMARIVPRYLQGLPPHLQPDYRHAESIAKARGRGIWSASSRRREATRSPAH